MNQLDAYRLVYKLALDNAEVLLDVAQESFQRERNGHAYSLAVLANEEIVKAYVSWGVS
jgi:AbiV family abortive infection protein